VPDVIQLLPDSVANQIAAGEVIQRPASVVKELVENSLDAGAGEILIHIKDAGKTLIQVTDNGCGLSPTDARMAFERHATSKIREAGDLYAIRTMGFRGEALASIAAIADVEIRTRRDEDETGTYLHLSATRVISQEPAACNRGASLMVKNLFFNVPARRKFLKSDSYELKNILVELQRVAAPNPEVTFRLYHNNNLLLDLPAGPLKKRLSGLFGKNISQSLIPVAIDTTLASVSGFTGLPKFARKTMGEQFFFVNRRYMRHPWFHKAVMQAYEKLLPADSFPSYFLFLEVDPTAIDINVHPTKTEIKFENENAIWQIIHAVVRESLGKNSVMPSIDFDQEGSIDIPLAPKPGTRVPEPAVFLTPGYNPFADREGASASQLPDWELLYREGEDQRRERLPCNQDPDSGGQRQIFPGGEAFSPGRKILQVKQKYLVLPVKSGMMFIDRKRAQERIFFERFLEQMRTEQVASQQLLYPHTFELNPVDAGLLRETLPELQALGFDIGEFGRSSYVITGVPSLLVTGSPVDIVEKLLEDFKNAPLSGRERLREQIAGLLARATALNAGDQLLPGEPDQLVDQLFACSAPNYTPDGRPVLVILSAEEIDKYFSR